MTGRSQTYAENYTNPQRLEYLQRALDLEEQKARQEKELAEQNLANLRARAEQTENDAEMNEKLAAAEIEVINADTRLSETQRGMTKEMNRLHKEIRDEGVAAWNAYVGKIKEMREEMDKAWDAMSKMRGIMSTDVKVAVDEMAPSFEKLRDVVEDIPDTLSPSTMDQFAASFQRNASTISETSSALQSSFGSLASIYEQMAKDESKSEEERAEAAKKAKAWSALQIAANSGTAIAKGIASAMDTPFPGNIAAIATTLAAVLSAIAQAKALAAETYETGGVIGGYRGATMGTDNTYIHARRGEMVINANQQRQLFELANGGSMGGSIAASLVSALQSMPAPVLDYSEFTNFTNRVASLDELAKIK